MKDNRTKKELQTQYKEREITGGIFIIKNLINNKILLETTADIKGSCNRFKFSQETGSCVYMKLQNDWNKHGGESFVLEVLEELVKSKTETSEEFMTDICILKEMWLEKLSDDDFY